MAEPHATPLQTTPTSNTARFCLALTISILIAGAVFGYLNAKHLADDSNRVAHIHEVLGALETLCSTVKDAETGQRGYLLTEDEKYREPYNRALTHIDANIARLKQLTSDNAEEQIRLAALEQKIGIKLDELKQTIALMERHDRPAALALVKDDRGRALMEEVREQVVSMQQQEQGLLRQRRDQSAASLRVTIASILLPALFGVLLVGLVYYRSQRHLSKRQRSAEVLAEQKERLRTTLSSIGDAVIATDPEGRITDMNPIAEALTGWRSNDAAGLNLNVVFKIVNEHTRQPVASPVMRALKEGIIVGLANHTILIAKDNTERPIDDSAAPIRCRLGEIVGCVLVFRDVSERKQVESELAGGEEQFRILAESIPQLAWMANADGYIFWYNRRWYDYTGTTFQQMQGWGWQSVHDPVELPKVMERWTGSIASGQPFDMTFPLKGADNTFRLFLTRVSPVKDEDGKIYRWVGTNTDISETKKDEERLRESEARFRLLADTMPQIVWTSGPDGHVDYFNDRWYQFTGCAPESVGEENWGPIVHPDDYSRSRDEWYRCVAEERVYQLECRFQNGRTKEYRWFLNRALPIRDANGQVIKWFGTSTDIEDFKRVEGELRASEERVRLATEAAELGIWVWHIDEDRVIWENARLYAMFGLAQNDEPINAARFKNEFVHPDDAAAFERAISDSLLNGSRFYFLGRFRRIDGEERWTEFTGQLVVEEDGKPRRMHGTAADVTERKRAEADRQKFVRLAENSTDFIAMYDLEYRPTYLNLAGLKMVGLEQMETARRIPLRDFFFPEDQSKIMDDFFPLVIQQGHGEMEIRFRNFKTGHSLWMIFTAFVMTDDQGRRVGLATVSRNITERRQLEDHLRKLAADLSEADHRKDEFLATLAHELRNPLAPIRNGLEILRLAGPGGRAIEQARSMMDRQLTQMVRLVDDLLDVSRITRNKLELRKQRLELSTVLHNAVETSRPVIDGSGHQLSVNLPSAPIIVDGDNTRLGQVFANLLNNAAKYSDRGGYIQLTALLDVGEVVVSVRDTGVGIPADMLPKIFDMFTQVDRSLEKSQGGLGIGLTLVKRLVEMHGGRVEARSEGQGKGSEFIVHLPLLQSPAPEAPLQVADVTTVSQRVQRRILVADDNEDSAASLAMMLEMMGNEVTTAHDGVRAVEEAAKFRPDIILLDIGMPRLNGYEACRQIRKETWGQQAIVIALTGWGQDEDRRRSKEAGFDHHLVKPVDPAALVKLLDSLAV